MSANCLNCGMIITDNYCPHCGQKADTASLNWHSISHPVFHFLTHIEEGFLKTARDLALNPGRLFKNYIEGKRKRYHHPVTFLLIWAAVFLLVYKLLDHLTDFPDLNGITFYSLDLPTWKVFYKYRSIVELLLLPFLALINWLFTGRPKLNYIEVLAVYFYIFAFGTILACLLVILCAIFHLNFHTPGFDLVNLLLFGGYTCYALYDFYKLFHIRLVLLRVVLVSWLSILLYMYFIKLIVHLFTILHIV